MQTIERPSPNFDERALPISMIVLHYTGMPDCEGVTLALPHLLGGEGVLGKIPLPLDNAERDGLRRSAGILREAIQSLNLK